MIALAALSTGLGVYRALTHDPVYAALGAGVTMFVILVLWETR